MNLITVHVAYRFRMDSVVKPKKQKRSAVKNHTAAEENKPETLREDAAEQDADRMESFRIVMSRPHLSATV